MVWGGESCGRRAAYLVEDDEEEVESGEQGIGQADVLLHAAVAVVLAVHRVGRRQHTDGGKHMDVVSQSFVGEEEEGSGVKALVQVVSRTCSAR